MIFKNVANQKLPLYLQDSSGNPKTGEAANITAYISVDGGTPQTVTGVTEIGGGFYYITPSQAQTNGHLLTWWGTHATYICRGGAAFTSDAYTKERAQALDKLDIAVSSRAPADTALSNTVWTDARAEKLDNLDAAVSSRLKADDYTAPDNASIAAIKLQTDKLEFVGNDVKATLDDEAVIVGGYLANQSPSSQIQTLGYTAERAEKLDNLDAAISSRLDAGDYIAPDNASIAAIKSQTDKLSFVGSDVKATLDNEQVTVAVNNDKTGYSLTADYDRAKTALAITEYIAPDNDGISAIKEKTDRLRFDTNDNVYATGLGGGGGVQVVVQPLTASVQRTDGAGGVISGWTYARLVASWNVKDVDLSGHDLRLLLYNRNDPGSAIVEYSTGAGEITITYNNPDSLVEVDGPDSKTPNAGNYAYVLRDQTTDTVLLSGNCLIQAAPDAG